MLRSCPQAAPMLPQTGFKRARPDPNGPPIRIDERPNIEDFAHALASRPLRYVRKPSPAFTDHGGNIQLKSRGRRTT